MIKIELLSKANFCLESLDSYNRKQNVNKVCRKLFEAGKAGYRKIGTAGWRKGKFILMEKVLRSEI